MLFTQGTPLPLEGGVNKVRAVAQQGGLFDADCKPRVLCDNTTCKIARITVAGTNQPFLVVRSW